MASGKKGKCSRQIFQGARGKKNPLMRNVYSQRGTLDLKNSKHVKDYTPVP